MHCSSSVFAKRLSCGLTVAALATLLGAPISFGAEEPLPMIGRQSHNTGIRALPAPGKVVIDGELNDWDLSGRIWSFADIAVRDRYSAETAVMWDKDYLYLAVKFRDPDPAGNQINPNFDPESGWKGDSIQLRLNTDNPQWLTIWGFTAEKIGVIHRAVWKSPTALKDGLDTSLLIGKAGEIDLGEGAQMAVKVGEDKKSYVQEIRIPWKILYKKVPEIQAGIVFKMGMEFFWGNSGSVSSFPIHRYADNLQVGHTSREFFWTALNAWGNVELMEKGNVKPLVYIPAGGKLEGSIPMEIALPLNAKEFTVVVETPDGKRVRNLGAQLEVERYQKEVKGDQRIVSVLWDGCDDEGKLVAPGNYKVRGLSHEGLGADYVMSFYNPGTPPWESGTKGGWGADHCAASSVSTAGDWTVLGWEFAEGGSGIVAVGPDGLKKWGEKRGVLALASDANSVYFISNSWHEKGNLCRLNLKDGKYKPFKKEGNERPFELPLAQILGSDVEAFGDPVALTVFEKQLAIAGSGGKVAFIDNETASLNRTVDVPEVRAVAFGPKGEFYAISKEKVVFVNPETGALKEIATPGLAKIGHHHHIPNDPKLKRAAYAYPFAIDRDGNIGLFDQGPDQQVKFFTPEGKAAYAVGQKGGRPYRGDFNDQAMTHVSAASVDHLGNVWVTENWEYPRRVSVWGKDGKLVKEYIGNTGYAASGAFLHDEDPNRAYYGPVEIALDRANATSKVKRILWVPGEGEHFRIEPSTHAHPHVFTHTHQGKKREFMYVPPYKATAPSVLYMEGETGWRPVSAFGIVGHLSGKLDDRDGDLVEQPSGEYAGHDAYENFLWNDTNKNGKVDLSEVIFFPVERPTVIGRRNKLTFEYYGGWGTRMNPNDLSVIFREGSRIAPTSFTDEGAPLYTKESISEFNRVLARNGDVVAIPAENRVISLQWEAYFGKKGLYGGDAKTGEIQWSYPNPYPGVHGSHRATMPQPGLLIGPLKILGTAELPNKNGHVFGLRGNLGQDFYFTSDGLFISTMFQDGRLPVMGLPSTEKELIGSPIEGLSGGGEPFNGWFGKHSDGVIRMVNGLARQAAMISEMKGFDKIKRFSGPELKVTEAQLSQAEKENEARAEAKRKSTERKATIAKAKAPLTIDGKGTDWKGIPSFKIENEVSAFKGSAQLAYDDKNLYIAIEAEDPTPWRNLGNDVTRLFKTGDSVDIQLATNPKADAARTGPAKGDLRVVIAPFEKKETAVLMRPVSPNAPAGSKRVYVSPVGEKVVEEVRPLSDVKIAVEKRDRGFRVEAAIPLSDLELTPVPGEAIKGDVGFISSDAEGRSNIARTYWSSTMTNLVNDEPIEAWLAPDRWGTLLFEK